MTTWIAVTLIVLGAVAALAVYVTIVGIVQGLFMRISGSWCNSTTYSGEKRPHGSCMHDEGGWFIGALWPLSPLVIVGYLLFGLVGLGADLVSPKEVAK